MLVFSFRGFIALLSRTLEFTIFVGTVLNLLWVFFFHEHQSSEIFVSGFLQSLAALFLMVQISRLFLNWRLAFFGIARALLYLLICGFQYL